MSDQLKDNAPFGKYFTVMLNMDDDDLDPFAYRLLAHYRRVCGRNSEATCFEAVETTAKICQMGITKTRVTRQQLTALGYIRVEQREKGRSLHITLVDRMAENVARYTPIKKDTPTEFNTPTPIENIPTPLSNSIPKEEPSKDNPSKNDSSTPPDVLPPKDLEGKNPMEREKGLPAIPATPPAPLPKVPTKGSPPVVNIHSAAWLDAPADQRVYIGRTSSGYIDVGWGNPYVIDAIHDRAEVIAHYRAYILSTPALLARLPELKDKVLGCWCKPEACHGDVLADLCRTIPQPHVTRIDAWLSAQPPQAVKDDNVYKRNSRVATAMTSVTPLEIYEFVQARRQEDFWAGKWMSLEYVAQNIGAWLHDRRNPRANVSTHTGASETPKHKPVPDYFGRHKPIPPTSAGKPKN